MPGIDVSRFDQKVEEDFICSICLGVLLNPVQDKCEHLFCSDCIKEWLEKSDPSSLKGNCPLSQEVIGWFELKPVSRIVRNLLANLSIHCKFRENGCLKSIRYDRLDEHEKECEFQLCPKGCGAVLVNQSEDHDCIVYLKSIIDWQTENINDLRNICALNQKEIQEKKNEFDKLLSILDTTAPQIDQKITEMEDQMRKVKGGMKNLRNIHIMYLSTRSSNFSEIDSLLTQLRTSIRDTSVEIISSNPLSLGSRGSSFIEVVNIVSYHLGKSDPYKVYKLISTQEVFKKICKPSFWPKVFECVIPGEVIKGFQGKA